MLSAINVHAKEVSAIIKATFPAFKGRKASILPKGKITFSNLNWDDGVKSEYAACTLDGVKLGDMSKHGQTAPWLNVAEGVTVEIPQGAVVVEYARYQGQVSIFIHVNSADMPKWLPNPQVKAINAV